MTHALADIKARDKQAEMDKNGDLTVDAIGLYESVGFEIVEVVRTILSTLCRADL